MMTDLFNEVKILVKNILQTSNDRRSFALLLLEIDPLFRDELGDDSTPEAFAADFVDRLSSLNTEKSVDAFRSLFDLIKKQPANDNDDSHLNNLLLLIEKNLEQQATTSTAISKNPLPRRHVFISYAHVDKEWTKSLFTDLTNSDILAWYDDHLEPGKGWDDSVQKAIDDCFALVFIITPESIKSPNCSDEWSYALKQGKPVFPLLVKDSPLPLRLHRLQYIDFTRGYSAAFEKLRTTLERSLEISNDLQKEVAQTIIRHELGQIGLRRRVMYVPPRYVENTFKDRVRERAYIANILIDPSSAYAAVSIYGRGGVGKTALACRIMAELEHDNHNVDGLVFMSSRTGGLTLEKLYLGLAELLGGEDKDKLIATWVSPDYTVSDKIHELITNLMRHRIIILLDNFEDILDRDGSPIDSDIAIFLNDFLRFPHQSKLLITSRKVIQLDADVQHRERNFPLEEGLPEEDAIVLLKEFDPNGYKGLRDSANDLLIEAARKTAGLPRALEYINAILTQNRSLTLKRLLNNANLFTEHVTEKLMAEAQRNLNTEEQRVMQAAAIYRVPVSDTAFALMLQPYGIEDNLDSILQNLVDRSLLAFNRSTETYSIHPLDADYNYHQIPSDESEPFSLRTLHTLAANYYRNRRLPESMWREISDLDAPISEFDHLVKAEDYDNAVELINLIDYRFLSLWGHFERLKFMRSSLLGKISNKALSAENLVFLGYTHYLLAQYETAEKYCREGITIALQANSRYIEALALNILGLIQQMFYNDYIAALTLHGQALRLFVELQNHYWHAAMYTNIGYCYVALGVADKAIASFKQTFEIEYDLERDDRAYDYAGLAEALLLDSQFEEAYKNASIAFEQSLNIHAVEIVNDAGYIFVLTCLAQIRLDEAKQTLEVMLSDEYRLSRLYDWFRLIAGILALHDHNYDSAQSQVNEAIENLETVTKTGQRRIDTFFWRGIAYLVRSIVSNDPKSADFARELFETGLQEKLQPGRQYQLMIVLNFINAHEKRAEALISLLEVSKGA